MKKQIKLITATVILCSLFSINAQNINVDIATERNLMSKNVSSKINADGSPYINENFSTISITQYQGSTYNARYNAYNGEMEVMVENNKVIALDNNGDFEIKFTSDNKIYRTINYTTNKNISKRGFLVVLSEDDKHGLFKEERIKFYEKVEAASSYQQDKPAKFKREDDRYYVKLNGNITFIPQKKKDFLKAFPEQASKLKSYMKKNKLNPKNEDQLITLVKYLSTIVVEEKTKKS